MPWRSGDPITAEKLQWMVDTAVRKVVGGPGVANVGGVAALLSPPDSGTGSRTIRRFKVTAVANDYLTCVHYDATASAAGTTDIYVAKPHHLRGGGGDYAADQYVLAVFRPWGGTGVTGGDATACLWEALTQRESGGGGTLVANTVELAANTAVQNEAKLCEVALDAGTYLISANVLYSAQSEETATNIRIWIEDEDDDEILVAYSNSGGITSEWGDSAPITPARVVLGDADVLELWAQGGSAYVLGTASGNHGTYLTAVGPLTM